MQTDCCYASTVSFTFISPREMEIIYVWPLVNYPFAIEQWSEMTVLVSSSVVVNVYILRMATQYAPAPLLPHGRPSASCAAEQLQRSSTFPRQIHSHADRCSRLAR